MARGGVVVTDTATQGLKDWDRQTKSLLVKTMKVACNRVKYKSQQKLRWRARKGKGLGGRATGQLSRSINYRVRFKPGMISGEVGAGVKYAKYIEGWNKAGEHKPTERHLVTFKIAPDLRKWAVRHGIPVPARGGALMVGGPEATTPFFEPTLKEMEGPVNKMFQRAMRRATRG